MTSEIIDSLNELLEAERAGVETLSAMKEVYPELAGDLERVEKDEAWSCAGLHRSILALGGVASDGKGDFAVKVLAQPTLEDRLQLLARGQQWVVKRIDALLEKVSLPDIISFIQEMKTVHQHNIAWCHIEIESLRKTR